MTNFYYRFLAPILNAFIITGIGFHRSFENPWYILIATLFSYAVYYFHPAVTINARQALMRQGGNLIILYIISFLAFVIYFGVIVAIYGF